MTYAEARMVVYARDQGMCRECERPAPYGHCAHVIPRTKGNVRRYGRRIMDHPLNLRWACSQTCNDLLSRSNHPLYKTALLAEISAALVREEAHA